MNSSLLPNPLFDYYRLFILLLPVASLCVAIGLMLSFEKASSLQDQLRAIVQVTAVVVLLAHFDTLVQTGQTCVKSMVKEGLGAEPDQLPLKFALKILATDNSGEDTGLWEQVTNIGTQIFHSLLAAFIAIIGLIAMVLFFLAYLAQELALEFGIGLSPIFIGFLLLPVTRSIGVQFLLYMLALVLFPLGWGAAALVSERLIEFTTSQNLESAQSATSALSFGMRNLFGALLLALWIIISTVFAPFAMLRAVTTGVHLSADAIRSTRQYFRH